jgi:hypothetical protein
MHHTTSNVSLAAASIYDSTQKAMDHSELFFELEDDENLANITNIEWLGETEEDAIYGGPNGYGIIAAPIGGPDGIITEVSEQKEGNGSVLAYALALPILLLLAAMLLLAKNKKKRKVKTKEQIFSARSFDNVLIGTGDPPDSFHEGMYHYMKNGNRYLSTNCPDCIETKMNGFFTDSDLETIAEHSIESESARSAYRKRCLVVPSKLGSKHSSVDVHHCTSARCPICIYRPDNVEFITKSQDFEMLQTDTLLSGVTKSEDFEMLQTDTLLAPGESEV